MRLIVCLVLGLSMASADAPTRALTRLEFEREAMGVPVRIVLYAETDEGGRVAAAQAFERIDALNAILSDYDPTSEVRLLCEAGSDTWVPLGEDLFCVLDRALEVAALSDGAFDVTCGPIVRLWRQARALHRLPAQDRLAEATARSGYGLVQLNREAHTARLSAAKMRIDLGGIAKGYVIDEALRSLSDSGIGSALVDAGGDIGVSGPPPGAEAWIVAVAPLNADGSRPMTLSLVYGAVATSGDKWQFVEIEGVRYSHIVDPRTGMAITGHHSVTIVARDAMTADAWATALNVLSPEEGIADLEAAEPDVAALCVVNDHGTERLYESSTWRYLVGAGKVSQR